MNATFLNHFAPITDPRIERCKKHDLLDIILLSITVVISGAEGWEYIEDLWTFEIRLASSVSPV